MSKQEIQKWGNKFVLWRTLHPLENWVRCKDCQHWSWNKKGAIKKCPVPLLVLRWDDAGEEWADEINPAKGMDFLCIEWIKHV